MANPELTSAAIELNPPVISATLDTSVYIRALHFGSPAAVIIGHARAGNIRIDISDAIVAETSRVPRDKFQWDGYMLQDARGKLLALGNHVSATETLHVIKEDPGDDRILECASAAKSDFIVSEDKDLLRLGNSVTPGSYRSGISSIWRLRQGRRDNFYAGAVTRGGQSASNASTSPSIPYGRNTSWQMIRACACTRSAGVTLSVTR